MSDIKRAKKGQRRRFVVHSLDMHGKSGLDSDHSPDPASSPTELSELLIKCSLRTYTNSSVRKKDFVPLWDSVDPALPHSRLPLYENGGKFRFAVSREKIFSFRHGGPRIYTWCSWFTRTF